MGDKKSHQQRDGVDEFMAAADVGNFGQRQRGYNSSSNHSNRLIYFANTSDTGGLSRSVRVILFFIKYDF